MSRSLQALVRYDCVITIKYEAKSNLSFYWLYYAETCNEFAEPISPQLRPENTTFYEKMSQRRRAVNNTMSYLISPRFELQIFHSRDKRVTVNQLNSLWKVIIGIRIAA